MQSAPQPRRHYIDWLRVLAVLLLFVYHAGLVDRTLSQALAGFLLFVHQWHMHLFFLLAGMSSFYALGVKTPRVYARERLLRLLVPLGFGLLAVAPVMKYLHLKNNPAYHQSFLEFYFRLDAFFDERGQLHYAHLWFVAYLLIYSLLALPLLVHLRQVSGQRWTSALGWLSDRRGEIFLLALPLAVIEAGLRAHWPRGYHVWDDWAGFALFFAYILLGYLLCADPRLERGLDRSWKWAGLLAGIGLVLMFWAYHSGVVPVQGHGPDGRFDYTPSFVLFQFCRGFHTWFWIVLILGLGRKYLNADNRVLKYSREAAYPVYILHYPFIILAASYAARLNLGIAPRLALIVVLSLLTTVLVYDLLVRRADVTRFLLGMKTGKSRG